jgi:fatty-acyl-CoA synthase
MLAGYKLPRTLVVVDRVERTPAGKPDYRWAKARALDAAP